MTAPELKPCPFCGNDTVEDWGETTWSRPAKWMYCVECQARGPRCVQERDEDYDAFPDRIKAEWNTRADLPPTLSAALALPEVRALVAAAKGLLFAHDHGNGLEGWHNTRERMRAALSAIGEGGE